MNGIKLICRKILYTCQNKAAPCHLHNLIPLVAKTWKADKEIFLPWVYGLTGNLLKSMLLG